MSGSLAPVGEFEAVAVPVDIDGFVTYVQFGETKTGKVQAIINFRLLSGEAIGAELSWTGYFTGSAIKTTVKALRACGFTGDDIAAAADQELTNRVRVVTEHEEYKGSTKARIRWVNMLGAGRVSKPLDRLRLKALGLLMREMVSEVSSEAAEPTAAAVPTSSSSKPGTDEDIPF
jgi:hypothetical protein